MATLRHAVRRALRDSTIGRYDRTYRRPHRRQACYGEFIMASFYQPRPRPGFLIDTSGSMEDTQLARAVAELGGLTRQLGYGADVVVACCDAAVHEVRKAFASTPIELYGGGGTDIGVGLRAFIERKIAPIDLLVIVSDCRTPWPKEAPPFPVITIRVGDGAPPPWGNRGANKVITIEEPGAAPLEDRTAKEMEHETMRRRPLTIPPDSMQDWVRLAVWEIWMGMLVCGALGFGTRLIATAPDNIVTVFDFTNCYAAPPIVQPCERVAYKAGALNVVFNAWCGLLLVAVAAWLLWELWSAVAPKPITDDFLKLLDDSFGRDWRSPRTWPWARVGWAYGFTLLGAVSAVCAALLVSAVMTSRPARAPTVHVETSQRFRQSP